MLYCLCSLTQPIPKTTHGDGSLAFYGNGDTREYEYDSKHRITKLKIDVQDRFAHNYDNLGNLHSYKDLIQRVTYTYMGEPSPCV